MSQPLPLLDDPHAPEFFASYLAGAAYDAPNVRLTFASVRVNHTTNPGPMNAVVNARLVMSIPAARLMCNFLNQFLQTAELNATQKPPDQSVQ
jgi:hypothetical protein